METATKERPALYVGTYAKYNNGSIAGKWLYLDDYEDADAFLKACRELHKDESDPELMFQDFECFPEAFYSETMNTEKLYTYINLDGDDRELLDEYLDATGYSIVDIDLDNLEDIRDKHYCTLEGPSFNRENEMGEYVVDSGLLGVIPEHLENYIDYEAIGREWLMDMSVSSNGFVFSD